MALGVHRPATALSPLTMIDSSRFLQIYDQYSGLILSYAVRRTRNVDDAADVLIEAYTVAWRRNYDMPSGKEARPWLYGIARRVMANQHRTVERRTRLDLELRSSATNGFVDPTAVEPDRADASAALECLSFDDRELLTLSAWDGLDSRDLAIVLGCSPGTARVRLRRARRRFEQHFATERDDELNTSDEPMDRLISVNPVNAEQLIACWSDNDAKALLLAEIMAMPVDGGSTRAT